MYGPLFVSAGPPVVKPLVRPGTDAAIAHPVGGRRVARPASTSTSRRRCAAPDRLPRTGAGRLRSARGATGSSDRSSRSATEMTARSSAPAARTSSNSRPKRPRLSWCAAPASRRRPRRTRAAGVVVARRSPAGPVASAARTRALRSAYRSSRTASRASTSHRSVPRQRRHLLAQPVQPQPVAEDEPGPGHVVEVAPARCGPTSMIGSAEYSGPAATTRRASSGRTRAST